MNCLSSSPTPDLRLQFWHLCQLVTTPGHFWARRAVGFRVIRHQLHLLELVRISERFSLAQGVGMIVAWSLAGALIAQVDSACADLIAPPCPLPAGSGTYTQCVMPR
jgi:hypothetical protein